MIHQFKTTSILTSTYGLGKALGLSAELLYTISTATVYWTIEIDIRDWGVKSVSPLVQRVVVEIQWSVNVEDLDGENTQGLVAATGASLSGDSADGIITVDTDEQWKGKTWEIINEMKPSDAIYPADCEIDFSNNTITIN